MLNDEDFERYRNYLHKQVSPNYKSAATNLGLACVAIVLAVLMLWFPDWIRSDRSKDHRTEMVSLGERYGLEVPLDVPTANAFAASNMDHARLLLFLILAYGGSQQLLSGLKDIFARRTNNAANILLLELVDRVSESRGTPNGDGPE